MDNTEQSNWLDREIQWIREIVAVAKESVVNGLTAPPYNEDSVPAPELEKGSLYHDLVSKHEFGIAERLVIALAISPYVSPGVCDAFNSDKKLLLKSKACKSAHGIMLLPTIQTALFLLAGENVSKRLQFLHLFETSHVFYRESILDVGDMHPGEPMYNSILNLTPTYRDLVIYGEYRPPRFSTEFPAHLLTTRLEWDDLILMPTTATTLDDVKITLRHYEKLFTDWKMGNIMRPGCRVLLYGDSGQGKTLTAALLGKLLARPVYRVDIAASVSKYVGETNQRLEALFNTAENKDWILFFDEGDAMLGQRNKGGENSSSHYANQEVAFLLQRIETFNGIIIVATNLRSNIDYAFQRRFDTAAQFKALDTERQQLVWNRFWPKEYLEISSSVDLELLIKRHPLSPASIINVIRRVASHMAEKKEKTVSPEMLQRFIQDEEYKFKGTGGFA